MHREIEEAAPALTVEISAGNNFADTPTDCSSIHP